MRMRTVACLAVLSLTGSSPALAQNTTVPKNAPDGGEVRYFTAIDGLMDGTADVILKETRQGRNVTSAVLDICYPTEPMSGRKDRFVATLTASGQTLTGTATSQVDKSPVTVKLIQKPAADSFEFRGQITIGQNVTQIASTDNSDLSEAEYRDNMPGDDTIVPAPKDFTEVSPESIAVKVRLADVVGLLRSLRGRHVEVASSTLEIPCEALRSGQQVFNLSIDPVRAPALVASLKAMPGVSAAGWSNGMFDMDRTMRFPAADWRDGDRINRDRIAQAIAAVVAQTMSAKPDSANWDENTGKLTLKLTRPSKAYSELGLSEAVEVEAMVSPDRPGASDHLMLWVGSPTVTIVDNSDGPKLALAEPYGGEGEDADPDDNGTLVALVQAFKAQRWNADDSAWK